MWVDGHNSERRAQIQWAGLNPCERCLLLFFFGAPIPATLRFGSPHSSEFLGCLCNHGYTGSNEKMRYYFLLLDSFVFTT